MARRAATAATKRCKVHPNRPAPYPGPRCYSCHNERKREVRLAAHGRRIKTTYNTTPEFYAALKEYQGGLCAICRRAKGEKRNLAVDHDHTCCPGPTSCGRCIRGLLCAPCNDILAHFRDDPTAGMRMAAYLTSWPSHRMPANLPWPPNRV